MNFRGGALLRRTWWFALPLGVLVFHLFVIFTVHPATEMVKDEVFFFPTVQRFHEAGLRGALALAVEGYGVPQPPLSFMLGALVYEVFPSLNALRVGNALLVGATLSTLFRLFERFAGIARVPKLLAVGTLLLNPYLHGIATLYYTDALYLALFALALSALVGQRRILLGVSLALAPLVRQFALFLALGSGLAMALHGGARLERLKRALPALVAPLGLLALMVAWGAATPSVVDNQRLAEVRAQYGVFHLDYVFYYSAALGFYCAPVAIALCLRAKGTRALSAMLVGGTVAVVGGALFPPVTNYYHVASGIDTLGYFHRLTQAGGPALGTAGFALARFLGGATLVRVVVERALPAELRFSIPVYLVMQGFNAFAWDKYLLDVIAIVLLAGVAHGSPPGAHPTKPVAPSPGVP